MLENVASVKQETSTPIVERVQFDGKKILRDSSDTLPNSIMNTFISQEHQVERPVNGNPHNTAIVFYEKGKKGWRKKMRDMGKLTAECLKGGFNVAMVSPQDNRDVAPGFYNYGPNLWEWPRDYFLNVPRKDSKTVFVHPSDAAKSILQETMGMIGEDYEQFNIVPSKLAEGGLSVWAGDVFIAQEKLKDDIGIPVLEAEGFTVAFAPHIKNRDHEELRRKRSDDAYQDSLKRVVERSRANDHVDTEISVIRDIKGKYYLIVNSSYQSVFSEEVNAIIEVLKSENEKNGIVDSDDLTISVPENEEDYLPANVITCPDGSIIINENAQKTVEMLSKKIGTDMVRTVKVEDTFDLGSRAGGGLRCSVNSLNVNHN
jgi:hypothetical protein